MAALYLFALRREGMAWSNQTRIWVCLKAAEYALVAVLILVAAGDLGRRWTVLVAGAFLTLLILRILVGRRAKRSPGWIDDT